MKVAWPRNISHGQVVSSDIATIIDDSKSRNSQGFYPSFKNHIKRIVDCAYSTELDPIYLFDNILQSGLSFKADMVLPTIFLKNNVRCAADGA